ncbi:hypothetical protein QWZ08_11265 [Ferruginibacter paludis]|uniref:hypothetical protein n=1 Tax=Ferruginibacter paludis TaxID=1310417 RepID=UPI0025B580E1|nr:hypothetical protein [Ferruginibacter paludis]MDN3656210.1 hypothetical protein [Ferruginibacter paludis]
MIKVLVAFNAARHCFNWGRKTILKLINFSKKGGLLTTLAGQVAHPVTFKNLQPAQKYWFRVTAVGSYQQEAVSDIISRVIQ